MHSPIIFALDKESGRVRGCEHDEFIGAREEQWATRIDR